MVIIDFETTGLVGPDALPLDKQPSIIELALVVLDDKTLKEKDKMDVLINPGKPLTAEINRITGIKDGDLVGAPPFAKVYPDLVVKFLGQRIMIAHNCAFEGKLLELELRRLGREFMFPWPSRRICTVEASMHLKKYRLKLGELFEIATGGKIQGAHRAMADVLTLAQIVRWMKEKGHINI